MFPYCCLLIICIMLFPCSVFKVHLSLFAQRRPRTLPRTSFNEYISKRISIIPEGDTSILHFSFFILHSSFEEVVGQSGLEPPTSRLSVVCSSQLSYWPVSLAVPVFQWWRLAGSNRWPPACKAGALPAELNPHGVVPSSISFASV